MTLIIVESPTKARTFNKILDEQKKGKGEDYFVYATMGHIRDLPSNKLSIDYEHDFAPTYKIIKNKEKVVAELKKLAKKHKEIIFATDPDREGESISYHAGYILDLVNEKWPEISVKDKKPLKRIIFHEITANALKEALEKPETLRLDLVKAQQARRILDRIVGYELSPLLWKKIGKNWLSAGRVQTVALRLIVEREKEIKSFKLEDYYQIYGNFAEVQKKDEEAIKAKLTKKDGISFEQKFKINLFAGEYIYTKTTIGKDNIEQIKTDLTGDSYKVTQVKETVQNRFPPSPFSTSLLQQEGFQKHGFSSKMTMRLAQDLYERGLISYHRTDSFNLSPEFMIKAKTYIEKTYGKEYTIESPRLFKTKSKMAQEAHEAIRPTKLDKSVDSLSEDPHLTQNHKRLYKLIFDRAVATQMKEASIKSLKLTIMSTKTYEFEAEMQKVLFDGFLRVLNPEYMEKNQKLSLLKEGDTVLLHSLEPQESQTKPPPRYNEASIIRTLEEKGIGRPSTYAPIISLIQEKIYVEKENKAFLPTKLGEVISDYLSSAFPKLFDLDFTAGMEESLDEIAEGKKEIVKLLADFNEPFQKELKVKKEDKGFIDVEEKVDAKCDKCGSPLVVRYSKFGKFMACSRYPDCKFTKPFLQFVPNQLCPKDGGRIVVRFTKSRKRFYGCENYPKCDFSAWNLNNLTPKNNPADSSQEKAENEAEVSQEVDKT